MIVAFGKQIILLREVRKRTLKIPPAGHLHPRLLSLLLLYNSDDQPKAAARHQGSYLYRLGGTPVLFQSLHPATVHRANARR